MGGGGRNHWGLSGLGIAPPGFFGSAAPIQRAAGIAGHDTVFPNHPVPQRLRLLCVGWAAPDDCRDSPGYSIHSNTDFRYNFIGLGDSFAGPPAQGTF